MSEIPLSQGKNPLTVSEFDALVEKNLAQYNNPDEPGDLSLGEIHAAKLEDLQAPPEVVKIFRPEELQALAQHRQNPVVYDEPAESRKAWVTDNDVSFMYPSSAIEPLLPDIPIPEELKKMRYNASPSAHVSVSTPLNNKMAHSTLASSWHAAYGYGNAEVNQMYQMYLCGAPLFAAEDVDSAEAVKKLADTIAFENTPPLASDPAFAGGHVHNYRGVMPSPQIHQAGLIAKDIAAIAPGNNFKSTVAKEKLKLALKAGSGGRELNYYDTPVGLVGLKILAQRQAAGHNGKIPEIKGVVLKNSSYPNYPRISGLTFTTTSKAKKRLLRQLQKRKAATTGPKRKMFLMMIKNVKRSMLKSRGGYLLGGRPGSMSKADHRRLDKRERDIVYLRSFEHRREVNMIHDNAVAMGLDPNVALAERFDPDFGKL